MYEKVVPRSFQIAFVPLCCCCAESAYLCYRLLLAQDVLEVIMRTLLQVTNDMGLLQFHYQSVPLIYSMLQGDAMSLINMRLLK